MTKSANRITLLRDADGDGVAEPINATPVQVVALPAGPRNHHWTKSLVAAPDGSRLYVGVGSNSNAAENGLTEEAGRAAIWEVDPVTAGRSGWPLTRAAHSWSQTTWATRCGE